MILAVIVGLALTQSAPHLGSGCDAREPEHLGSMEARTFLLAGRVLAPNGTPAEGTVVLSSAGGQTLSAADGSFQFEVQAAPDATCLRVSAVGSGDLMSSQQVRLPGSPGPVSVGPLQLHHGSACTASWLPTFGGREGTDGTVRAFAVFDDGNGAALFVGGDFTRAGGVASADFVAKWDGSSWVGLDSGMNENVPPSGGVKSLVVFDDGNGAALFAGGQFTTAGGGSANRIAKWDGSSWTPLGSGLDNRVDALTVFDDGSGEALYAGGGFTSAGGVAANRTARWDGTSWTALGHGNNGRVNSLRVFDDGSGAALFAGGQFTSAGGVPAHAVAKWDGSTWTALGSGIEGAATPSVNALAVFDDGGGNALFAGGHFLTAGGLSANNIAKWDGSSWTPLGRGVNDIVVAMTVFDDGGGEGLYAGGFFTTADSLAARRIAKWDGASWSSIPGGVISGVASHVESLAVFDDGAGEVLFVGGVLTAIGSVPTTQIAKWDGASWAPLGKWIGGGVDALAVFDDGTGDALFAGGTFSSAGGVAASKIAKWDGSTWTPLGAGVESFGYLTVNAMTVFDDGVGAALYAAGSFRTAGDAPANRIARWDGAHWTPLGSGLDSAAHALIVFDDGSGDALYAAGGFDRAGGMPANHVAKWDGTSWSPLGSGTDAYIYDLAVFDDGTGEAVYAGGAFTLAGGGSANYIAKWNGASWVPLSSGTDSTVLALAVFDDGAGAALYVGGTFTMAGGVLAKRIAKWDGASWTPLSSGLSSGGLSNDNVRVLSVFDDGGGEALFVGGRFASAGGVAANHIARWDGSDWTPLGSGVSNHSVVALAGFDDGSGHALFAGGAFSSAIDSSDSYLARWGCESPACTTFCSALPNATGFPAELSCSGAPGSSLVLTSAPVPNTTGQFFFGPVMSQGSAFGDGLRCIGGSTQRMLPLVQAGMMMQPANTATFAINYVAPYASGLTGTRYFQHWFQSGLPTGAGFNTSNGLAVTF